MRLTSGKISSTSTTSSPSTAPPPLIGSPSTTPLLINSSPSPSWEHRMASSIDSTYSLGWFFLDIAKICLMLLILRAWIRVWKGIASRIARRVAVSSAPSGRLLSWSRDGEISIYMDTLPSTAGLIYRTLPNWWGSPRRASMITIASWGSGSSTISISIVNSTRRWACLGVLWRITSLKKMRRRDRTKSIPKIYG